MLVLCQSLESPVEVDVFADPGSLVVASDLFEDVLATELRCALDHPREAAEEPPGT